MMQKVFDLETCVMCITSQSSRMFGDALDKELQKTNINRNIWLALYYIDHHGSINQKALADQIGITGASMTKIIQKMTADNFVTVQQSKEDKRQKDVSLTTTGQKQLMAIIPLVQKFQAEMTAGISQQELDTVATVMAKMRQNAQKIQEN